MNRTTLKAQSSAGAFGTGSFTTSSFTPGNNVLLVVRASFMNASSDSGEGSDMTIVDSLGTITWTTRHETFSSLDWGYGEKIWTAEVAAGASMTISIGSGGLDVDAYRVEVYQYTGYDTVTPTGVTAVGEIDTSLVDGPFSMDLSGAPQVTSEILAFVTIGTAGDPWDVTEGAGWTELFDVQPTSGYHSHSQVRPPGSTSVAVLWADMHTTGGGGVAACNMVALEIRAGPDAGLAPVLDGSVTSASPTTSGTTLVLPGLTTTAPGKVVVIFRSDGQLATSVTSASGLVFTARRHQVTAVGTEVISEYVATSPVPLAADVITATFPGTITSAAGTAFGIKGAYGFDLHPNAWTGRYPDPLRVDTMAPNTFVMGAFRTTDASPSAAAGWTAISNSNNFGVFYQRFSARQTGLDVPLGNVGSGTAGIADTWAAENMEPQGKRPVITFEQLDSDDGDMVAELSTKGWF